MSARPSEPRRSESESSTTVSGASAPVSNLVASHRRFFTEVTSLGISVITSWTKLERRPRTARGAMSTTVATQLTIGRASATRATRPHKRDDGAVRPYESSAGGAGPR